MNVKVRSEIEAFALALRQSEVVQNYITAKAEMEGDGQYAQFMRQFETQATANNLEALNIARQTVEKELPLRAYLQARIELVTLLQEINEQIAPGVGFNVAASLQPASCCG